MPAPQFFRWCFTLHEQDEQKLDSKFLESFKKLLSDHAKKWVFQKEAGEESGKHHLQGRLSLKGKHAMTKQAIIQLIKLPLVEIHWSPEQNESASSFYVTKEDTRIDGPWSNKDVAPYIPRKIRNLELRGWQADLADAMADYDDDRSIHFVLDKAGGIGKSTFCKYLACRKGAIVLPGTIGNADNLMKLAATSIGDRKECVTFLLDLPRAIRKDAWNDWLSALEQLKNGHICDWRYSGTNKWIEPPTICVFTNSLPDTSLLTSDRWKVHSPRRFDDPIPVTGLLGPLREPRLREDSQDSAAWDEFEAQIDLTCDSD